MERWLMWVGVVVTALYLGGLGWALQDRILALPSMPLSEIGDFLAGAFSPLAFLWLVIGYRMQALELAESRKVMAQQAHEAGQLVKVTREQLEAERAARELEQLRTRKRVEPALRVRSVSFLGAAQGLHELEIVNHGEMALDVMLTDTAGVLAGLPLHLADFPRKKAYTYQLDPESGDKSFDTFVLEACYTDTLKNRYISEWLISSSEDAEGMRVNVNALKTEYIPDLI